MVFLLSSCAANETDSESTSPESDASTAQTNTETVEAESDTENTADNVPELSFGKDMNLLMPEMSWATQNIIAEEMTGERVNDAQYNMKNAIEERFETSIIETYTSDVFSTTYVSNLVKGDEYSDNSLKDNPLDDSMMNLLTDSPYITDVKSIKGCSADILLPDKKEPSSFREIIGLSDDEFSSLSNNLLSEEISYQELVGKNGILIDDTAGMLKSWEDYSVALGDVVTIVSASGKKIELSVVGTIDMGDTDYNGTYFFVPENVLSEIYPEKKNFNTEFVINADVNQLPAAENVVLNAIGDNPDIQFNSFDDALSSIKMHMTGYQIPIYGLIVFIAIFGIINLCNTLMTNLVSRQQEFGVLQSIGLSNKQLYKMLRMECLYYVFGTMAITFVFGTAAGYILCQIFNQVGVFGKLHYTFPFLQVLLFFAVLVVIALIYSTLAIRYCHKQSLVDRIKTME